jgi:hypothetical protein
MKTLIYCLDTLKIEKNTELYRKALELQKDTKEDSNEWISAMKIIANAYSLLKSDSNSDSSSYIFSQSQLSDFLTLSAKGIEEKGMGSEIIKNVIFKIYRDIMENYENFSHSLKSNYLGIIIDVISILHNGVDTKGTRVNPINIEKCYQSRKQQATTTEEEEQKEKTATPTTAAAAVHKEKILLSNKDLVERLAMITNRERKELEESLARLQYSDLKKISELCRNYSRLQYYSKLITKEGSQEEFKNEIQRELGRELRSHQLGRAANSIRRARTYIENILDNKFTPDDTHGINHVRHNLEYGYQLMNLIERPKRRTQRTQ